MVRQGLGISPLTRDIAEFYPDLEEVLPSLKPIPVPVWLVTHRELHTSPRIRLVFDLLAESFSKIDSPYRPGGPAPAKAPEESRSEQKNRQISPDQA